ncbi:MAG TPA: hypothetical protein VFZ97_13880 [Acidimicrobiales bacterium]
MRVLRAYKFLDAAGRAPFTLTPWTAGEWVEAASAVPCHAGVHACRAGDLSYWLAPSLWEIELEEPVVETRHKLTARRGRLLTRIDAYPAAAVELGAVCAWRARDRAVQPLRESGADDLASRFEAATTLAELKDLMTETEDSTFEGTAAALAADAAHFALTGPISEAPFVCACSAGHIEAGPGGAQVDFDRGYAGERFFQSAWLTERLALAHD